MDKEKGNLEERIRELEIQNAILRDEVEELEGEAEAARREAGRRIYIAVPFRHEPLIDEPLVTYNKKEALREADALAGEYSLAYMITICPDNYSPGCTIRKVTPRG